MQESTEPPGRNGTGCLIAVLGIFGVLLICMVVGFARDAMSDESSKETIVIRGEVTLSPLAARSTIGADCNGEGTLRIETSSNDVGNVEVQRGTWRSDGSCAFAFAGNVPLADEYTFSFEGLGKTSRQRSMIDTVGDSGKTELEVRLSW